MALPLHIRRGLRGEQLAARYLHNKGYDIIAANYQTKLGETDIVAQAPDGTICFVEVKTRSPGQMLPPSDAVDTKKEENLKTNAEAFKKQTGLLTEPVRYDIIEVILYDLLTADINHIENAF